MVIRLRCFSCGKRLTVDEKYTGKRGKCPACGQVIMVPKSRVRQTTMLSVDYTTGPGYVPPRQGQVFENSRVRRAKIVSRGLLALGVIVLLIGIGITLFGARLPILRNWLGHSVTIEETEEKVSSEGTATPETEGVEEEEEAEKEEGEEQEQQQGEEGED